MLSWLLPVAMGKALGHCLPALLSPLTHLIFVARLHCTRRPARVDPQLDHVLVIATDAPTGS